MHAFNFVIVVDDAGEMKTVTSQELDAFANVSADLNDVLNQILDERAIAAGEYDPSDDDTPVEVR